MPLPLLTIETENWPLKKPFVIARSHRTETTVIKVSIMQGGACGYGECTPTARYGETVDSVLEQLAEIRPILEAGVDRERLQLLMPAGAARNAVDCALWDLEAKLTGIPVWRHFASHAPDQLQTVQTISIGDPATMAAEAAQLASFPVLKIKMNQEQVLEKLNAIHLAAPHSKLLVDANESWSEPLLRELLPALEQLPICLLEQPLKAGEDTALASISSGLPFGADESCHTAADLEEVAKAYQVINIKLDKSGGLSEAMKMVAKANALGLDVMTGCMLGTSLAMAPAMIVAARSRFVDLDAPILLAKDRNPGLNYHQQHLSGWTSKIWG